MTIIVIKFSQLCLLSKVFYGCCCKPVLWYMHGYQKKEEIFRPTGFGNKLYEKFLNACVCRLWISTLCAVYLFKGPNKSILPNTCIPNAYNCASLMPHTVQQLMHVRLVFDVNFK